MKVTLVSLMCLFSALPACLAAPLVNVVPLRAETDPHGMLITPLDRPAPAAGSEASLKVRFDLQNTTGHELPSPEIEVRIVSPEGKLKGIYGFQLEGALGVGETRRVLIRTDSLKVQADDTIILAPVHSVLEPTARESSGSGPQPKSLPVPEKYTPQQCDTLCSGKDLKCDAQCVCGVESFSCSCGTNGGYSYSCKCMTCPV